MSATVRMSWATIQISASIGATAIRAGVDAAVILREADAACYAAKRLGRHQIAIHESALPS